MASTSEPTALGREHNEDISRRMFVLNELARAQMVRAAAQLGIPFAQANALLQLDTPIAMRGLAAKLHCDPSNVTSIVDGLEATGLAYRQVNPADRRTKFLVVSERGAELRERYRSLSFDGLTWLAALSSEEQHTLRELLGKMLAAAMTAP